MQGDYLSGNTKVGTFGGTLLVVFLQLSVSQLLETAVLAAVGASVSFLISVLMKYVIGKVTKVQTPSPPKGGKDDVVGPHAP